MSQISNPQISNQIFSYSYTPNSNLPASITGPIHTVTNTWEPNRDVLDLKENKVGTTTISNYDYAVNAIGQRTGVATSGTAYPAIPSWLWSYDSLGQVIAADSTVATSDRSYQYDTIGNRQKSADSLTLPVANNYTTNALNQYTSRSVGGSPTLNPFHDFDGNMTSGPLPTAPTVNSLLVWDGENRLTRSTVGSVTTSYKYDAQSRRIAKIAGTATTSAAAIYLYDAWNCIADYSRSAGVSPTFTLKKTRLWGTDLSSTPQAAGGVAGLLSKSLISNPQSPIYYPTYDGNGNISEYLTATGTIAAHFEYDPFGNTVVNTDTGNLFTYRFSSKPRDTETGLYYYGYRFYDPMTGRWPSRDPIGEEGGINLYVFVENDGLNAWDTLGLTGPHQPRSKCSSYDKVRPMKNGSDKEGRTRRDARHYKSVNGCDIIPDFSFGMASFTDACHKHDICYQTCGMSKKGCDATMFVDMMAACDDISVVLYPLKVACRAHALAIHEALASGIGSKFEESQDYHCEWDCCEE